MRLLGFDFKRRLGEWVVVLRLEGRKVSLSGKCAMIWGIILGGLKVTLGIGGGVSRKQWRERMRICRKCPIADWEIKRCRPYSGSALGCGCFLPFLGLEAKPFEKGCWGKQNLPERGIGWE
jgi:hypothetical protein